LSSTGIILGEAQPAASKVQDKASAKTRRRPLLVGSLARAQGFMA
jgi:hypothetical protein